jgi:hypothetical protein
MKNCRSALTVVVCFGVCWCVWACGRICRQFKGRVALPRPSFEVSTGKGADLGLGDGFQVNLDEVNVLVDI